MSFQQVLGIAYYFICGIIDEEQMHIICAAVIKIFACMKEL